MSYVAVTASLLLRYAIYAPLNGMLSF